MLWARALGIPIFTAPSARASANRYTCGEQPSLPGEKSGNTSTITELSHFATYKSDATPTHPRVDVDPGLRSLLHQTAVVQQGAQQSSVLGLRMGSTCKQQSSFLKQTGEVGHHPDDQRVLREELAMRTVKHENFSPPQRRTERNQPPNAHLFQRGQSYSGCN